MNKKQNNGLYKLTIQSILSPKQKKEQLMKYYLAEAFPLK